MISDDELAHLVNEIDDFLAQVTIANKLAPMSVCGIVLARLALIADEIDATSEFIMLLEAAKERILESADFNQKQKNERLH